MISCDPCNPTSEEVCYCLLLALTTPTLSHPTSANPRFLIPPLTEEMNLSDPENFPSPLFRSQLCGARRVGRISSVILRAPEPSNGVWQRCPSRLARTCCWRFLVFPCCPRREAILSVVVMPPKSNLSGPCRFWRELSLLSDPHTLFLLLI